MPPGADQIQAIPMSPNLSQSFGRANEFAREQAHRALLLEHLLLALTEDPEAAGVLRACNVDIVRLSTDISGYLGRLTEDMRATPGTEPVTDPELMRVIEAARLAAQQSRRRTIDGAIVLAAIVGDGKSPAAGLLKTHGMTFDEAIKTLQKASAQARTKQYSTANVRPQQEPAASAAPKEAPPPPPPQPAPERQVAASAPSQSESAAQAGQTVDDILAAARARIQGRSTAAPAKPEPKPAAEPPKSEPDRAPSLRPLPAVSAPPSPDLPGLPDLPPLIARPPPAGAPGLPPMPPGASPAPPLPPGPPPAAPEPSTPPRAFQRLSQRLGGEGGPRPAPAPPRWPDGGPRGDWPDAEPALNARPPLPNGAVGGPRRQPAEAAWPQARPSAPPARSGARPAAGPLMEAIPRRMRVGTASPAHVRINRDKVDSLMQLLAASRSASARDAARPARDAVVAHVLSVRLQAPDGGFAIAADTPETQWVELRPGQAPEGYFGWRWTVTPVSGGRHNLQLSVSARTVSRDGIGPEASPPDRMIEVAVQRRRLRRLVRWMALIALLALGVGLGRLSQDRIAQDLVDLVTGIWKNILGLLVSSGFLAG